MAAAIWGPRSRATRPSVERRDGLAAPRAVATTRRVQRAKTLLDETTLPVSAIAFAAGFASIRRFNAALRSAYRRPPSVIRRAHHRRRAVAASPRSR